MRTLLGVMTRRSFLTLPALVAIRKQAFSGDAVHHFRYDHILGTSLDAAMWTASAADAERAADAMFDEIARLSGILNTRDPASEISRFGEAGQAARSRELSELFSVYEYWERRTGGALSIRPGGSGSPLNVDALGKAYIIDRAVIAARKAARAVQSVVLNIGGDIVVSGRACEIAVTDPAAPYDNGTPLTQVVVRNAAIATSGAYARGAHLLDARTSRPASAPPSATVIAPNAVTANALALAWCVADRGTGRSLLESTPGAVGLRIEPEGLLRTAGFARLERPALVRRVAAAADWPAGYQLTVSLTLTEGTPAFGGRGGRGGRGGSKRQYVAVWVENASGKLTRTIAFWADKGRYYPELSGFWNITGRNERSLWNVSRATRPPGKYELVWDGMDDQQHPVPAGTYKIVVETSQEHGSYAKQTGTINCGDAAASLMLSATANFEEVAIYYGPKTGQA